MPLSLPRPVRAPLLMALVLQAFSVGAVEQCYSDMDLDVPATTEGLYVNLATGVSGPTEGSVPGFDLDIYAAASTTPGGQMKFYWGNASIGAAGVATAGDTYAVLGPDQTIGPASLFTRAAFTGDTSAWQAGTAGYLGLRFRDEASGGIVYGWLLLSTTAPLGFPATIADWCFEDDGTAITTPAVSTSVFADGFED